MAKYKGAVEKMVRDNVNADVDQERLWTLRSAQKADLYWRGMQWIAPQLTDQGILAFSSLGSPIASAGNLKNSNPAGAYDYVQNIYRGYGRKFVAVLGQRMPNVKAAPDDPDDEESLKVTNLADVSASILRSAWNSEERSLELAMFLWTTGTCFAYTPWVTDGYKYGYKTEPKIESRQVPTGPDKDSCVQCGFEQPSQPGQPSPPDCPNCQTPGTMQQVPSPTMAIPEMTGTSQYENGAVEFHLCSVFTVSVPYFSHSLDDAPWLSYEYDEYKAKLKKNYPELRKNPPKEGAGMESSASVLGTQVRDSAASPLAVPSPNRANRWNYRRIWLKPEMFQALDDDAQVEELTKQYPDGMKVTLIEGDCYEIENEKLTDVWAVCKPDTSQYIYADAIGLDMMGAQDLKNDTTNLAYQTIEGGIPPVFVDPRVIDVEWWNTNQAVPNRVVPVIGAVGSSLGEAFYQPLASQFSEQMLPWMAGVENDAKTIVGTTDSLYGVAPTEERTAHDAELQKNAAMQQLQTTFTYVRKFWEQSFTNGTKQLARYGAGMMRHVRKGEEGYESLILDVAQLKESGWHFEADPSFPMTVAEQRAALIWLLGMNANVLQGLGITHPRNIAHAQSLLGLTGWYSPNEDEHEKAQETIRELLKGKPIQQPQPDGSMQPAPSIPIDQFEDNHGVMAVEAQSWCLSSIGRRIRIQNEDGYQNVVAWGMAHAKAAQPPPPQPPPLSTKLNVSAKISDLLPDERQKLDQDAHLAPETPPIIGQVPPIPPVPGVGPMANPQIPGAMPPGGPLPGAGASPAAPLVQ